MPETSTHDIAVVGAGISGLTLAWYAKRAGLDVALLEAGDDVGGVMQTRRRDGFLLEQGPFNVMIRDPAFEELINKLGDSISVITADEAAKGRFIYRRGGLIQVPGGPMAFARSNILSLSGKLHATRGLIASRRGDDRDYSIAEFGRRRFGAEATETLLSAVVSGILAGDIDKLSLKSCFPTLHKFDREQISPLGYEIKRMVRPPRGEDGRPIRRKWKGLVSFQGGLGRLGQTLADDIGAGLRTGFRVISIDRRSDGFVVTGQSPIGHEVVTAKRIALALPAQETARLVQPLDVDLSSTLASIESVSLVVLNLAFRSTDVGHPMKGFGFLVPRNEPDIPVMGVLWADSAFPHHGRPGHRLIRVFMGGVRSPDTVNLGDDDLLERVMSALRPLLSIRGEPKLVDICRYPNAIPQYHVGYEQTTANIRSQAARIPGLHLVGNYLQGVSINDCVRVAGHEASRVIESYSPVKDCSTQWISRPAPVEMVQS